MEYCFNAMKEKKVAKWGKPQKNLKKNFLPGIPNDRCPERAGPVWFYLDKDMAWKRDDPTLKIFCP